MSRIAHIVTEDGQTFAAVIADDGAVLHAMHVDNVDPNNLADQANAAIYEGALDDALDLTGQLAWGSAQEISTYFEVLI